VREAGGHAVEGSLSATGSNRSKWFLTPETAAGATWKSGASAPRQGPTVIRASAPAVAVPDIANNDNQP